MDIEVSIIMPVYNAERYLDCILQDVLSQSVEDFEFIIIDDGSTDGSRKICEHYAEMDKRIRFFAKENQGVSSARNFGIQKARGKYLKFIDSDDRLPDKSLELLLEAFRQEDNIDLVIGEYTVDCNFYTGDYRGVRNREEFMLHFLKYLPSFYYGVVWNKLYKTAVIKENAIEFIPGLQFAEDMRFNCEYYKYCNKVFYVDESVYDYVRRGNSLTDISTKRGLDEQLESELERFEAVRKLIASQENPQYEALLYDYLFNRLHMAFSGVFIYCQKSEYRKIFRKMISSPHIVQLLEECTQKSSYTVNNMLAWGIKKRHYQGLYLFYLAKNFAKKNIRIKEYLRRSEKYQRKFPL